jgi:hypothetical protein
MGTWKYKCCWIHDNFTTGEVTVQLPDWSLIKVKSVHAAKCRITREEKKLKL